MKSMLSQSVSIEESDDEVLDMLLDEAIPTDTVFPMSVTDTIAQQAVYPEAHPVPPPNNNENDGEAVIHGNSRCDPGNKIIFPFPDEKFFLLYCYAHGIMRPKSRVDLEFLWMLLDRLGVSTPSLDSILSFQIDGLENMLPVKKAYGDGHPFYWIPPSKHIKMQLATPHVAEQLIRYPKLTENKIQEMCQTSSATVNGQTVFVGDVVGFYGRDNSKAYGKVQKFFAKEVNNCLEFMCEILKVYVHHHMVTDYLVISEDLDVLKINEIDEICETPLAYKDVNGVRSTATSENAFQLGQPMTDIVVKSTVGQINNCRSERAKIMLRRDTGVSERGGQFDILKTFEACKQTPIEILHTTLLGCEKYLLAKTMKTLSPANKKKVSAHSWAQVAVFVLVDIVPSDELEVWVHLSNVFSIAYCSEVNLNDREKVNDVVSQFINSLLDIHPEFRRKPKIHMLLHMFDHMVEFGPAIGFSTERFEAFNSVIRQMNIYSNRQACSKDIAQTFAKHKLLQFILNGGCWGKGYRQSASEHLQQLGRNNKLVKFMYEDCVKTNSDREIYQPGSPRLGKYANGRLQTFEVGSLLLKAAIERDMAGSLEEKCHYYQGCISSNKELI
ncbi:Hypothetical predicted protein [Paramuricea clavata]|uniref:Uncharacterized protein n=1 Tax=Paramuricea clavata TaxID=317549 RepID=A0A7D9HM88_PARCT|nr:Hypothetical predicted protein [Paramuricea clavata]